MIRTLICIFAVGILASGCCGPIGYGSGCGVGQCNDCDGTYQVNPYGSPLDTLRQMRRKIICGSGCGETYLGEWRSTPPDCVDPCCNNQWVGGAVAARPFCLKPGDLLRCLTPNLYGGRVCGECGESFGSCGCGGGFTNGGYTERGGYVDEGGSCGCASCNSGSQINGTRMATEPFPGSSASANSNRTASRTFIPNSKSR